MKKYRIGVTESINHEYEFDAEDEEQAYEQYYKLNDEELKNKDLDGSSDWDSPWDIRVIGEYE